MQQLKNGAALIERRGDVVLAKTTGGSYVTWVIDESGNTFWGHYNRNLEEAVTEFAERAKARSAIHGERSGGS